MEYACRKKIQRLRRSFTEVIYNQRQYIINISQTMLIQFFGDMI